MQKYRNIFLSILMFSASLALSGSYIESQKFLINGATEETLFQYEEYIKKNAPEEDAFIAIERIAEKYINQRDWEQAIQIFKEHEIYFPGMKRRINNIIALLSAKLENLIPINLGPGINTAANEYSPIPRADETGIYFTGYNRGEEYSLEDIYSAEKVDGVWQAAQPIEFPINNPSNQAPEGISADGNRLILFGHYEGTLGRGDLFYSDKTKDGWGVVQHLPAPINSEYFDCDGKLTSDGKAIIFVSDRPGGVGEYHRIHDFFHGGANGNTDIYVCVKTDSGWSKAINLGTVINTPYAERKPFLHPDGKSLYFSSEGHYGIGRLDLFRSVRLNEDSWTEWSEPVNLGKEINTTADDWGAIVSTEGDIAYFASRQRDENFGETDIYSIKLPKFARPEKVVTIKGKVIDSEGNPAEAEIVWEDLETGKIKGVLRSDPKTGAYFIALSLGKNYGYYAKKDGYFPITKNIDLRDKKITGEIYENIIIYSIAKLEGNNIRINNLFFEFNEDAIKPESYPELERLVNLLRSIPSVKVEIAGHCDFMGTDDYNDNLSIRRASAVVHYLIRRGISRERLLPKGYGKRIPLTTNDTEEGRALNRRVEFKLW